LHFFALRHAAVWSALGAARIGLLRFMLRLPKLRHQLPRVPGHAIFDANPLRINSDALHRGRVTTDWLNPDKFCVNVELKRGGPFDFGHPLVEFWLLGKPAIILGMPRD
jgi:hypothetical protein